MIAAQERSQTVRNIQPRSPAQAKVQAYLDELVSKHLETGIQAAAYLDGELVVDAWSGVANPESGKPVDRDTLFLTFSCSKAVTATVIHQLVEAGKLDYDTPIAHYWPAFAKHGKESITVRQVLTHQAGIPQTPKGTTPETLADLDWSARAVENLKPMWKAGTTVAYHGINYGTILGELAQRVDGRPFAQIVQEDICQPLGIHALYFGVPPEEEAKVATIGGDPAPLILRLPFMLFRKVAPPAIGLGPLWNSPFIRRGVIPGGNMITNAWSLARHYAALIGDGVNGVRLLPEARVKIASSLQTDAGDRVFFGSRDPKGLGYWLGGDDDNAFGSRGSVFGHPGTGGSVGFADPEYNFSFALLKNQVTWRGEEDADVKVARVVREALGIPN